MFLTLGRRDGLMADILRDERARRGVPGQMMFVYLSEDTEAASLQVKVASDRVSAPHK